MLDFIINLLTGPGPQYMADGTPILQGWVLPAIMAASTVGNWIMGSRAQSKADKANRRALELGERRYAESEPFRNMALQSLQSLPTQGPDLTGAFADPSNPFSRPVQPLRFPKPGPVANAGGGR